MPPNPTEDPGWVDDPTRSQEPLEVLQRRRALGARTVPAGVGELPGWLAGG
ncbi:MAG TPA: hypothetical protein VNB06_10480 [Thermoanaerobaculia bacterium]|nr:hypothetical protein [Thermoanaerobaculia bacterium]